MYTSRIDWMGCVFEIRRVTPEAALRDRILKIKSLQASNPKPRRSVQIRAE
jgi:hypothetical protein